MGFGFGESTALSLDAILNWRPVDTIVHDQNGRHCRLQRLLPPTLSISGPEERSSHATPICTSPDRRSLGRMDNGIT